MTVHVFPGCATAADIQAICDSHNLQVRADPRTGALTLEQKRERAIRYLRERNLYALDRGSTPPSPILDGPHVLTDGPTPPRAA